ncbi:major facilitator superfamily transporter [Rhizoctonia solani]|uniref:Major facilitator superfamily transporter n=1 Tax=Rhizoctonia solani TaxID=456999 RepID=A0A8H8T343_9AGAM|nr:major facilitator superfamily transporter [Rhizoctonia solani]QRW26487.1 major facilitator superfamily transporter [Rhizoctonia solani]
MGHVDFFSSTAMENNQQSGKLTTQQSGEGDIDRKSVGDIENPPVATNAEASQGQYLTGAKLALAFVGMLLSIYYTDLAILNIDMRLVLVALDQTIVATALPKIASHFDALSQVSWIVSGYFLTQAGLLLLYGQLLIVASTKWIYVAAVLIFEIGSLFCAVAPSAEFLIFGRAVAGTGAAGIFISILSIIAQVTRLEDRPLLFGLFGAVFAVSSRTLDFVIGLRPALRRDPDYAKLATEEDVHPPKLNRGLA